ncbi:response regulator transcription factor [Variovorax dokdonensis]|uniref:Response regulator transcription factor n=1 Tax=Variovorax dokdonensis TaxID=344883 RepID=A0ABT7N8R9_9BURK|nr:response regulator transcription factor [Variovorax dokdonensis]MDM0044339.1 response regulator transcription factor [Variovorax dokdonensis]
MHSILIVDDHPAIRLAVRSVMEGSGQYKVVGEADSGPVALSLIRELQPALVLLDLDLPKMNGLELIERVKATQPSVKVLVLSAQQEAIFSTRALQAGANGFLSKSEGMTSIVQAAQAVMSGYSVFPSSAISSSTSGTGTSGAELLKTLSDRELTVLQQLARGMSNKEIGEALLISNKTVSSYKARLFEKLNISTLVELVDFARANNLVT